MQQPDRSGGPTDTERVVALEAELQRALQEARDFRDRVVDLEVSVAQLREAHEVMERTRALAEEMRIASDIQTSVLPGEQRLRGLEFAARMAPAAIVGGDYYDVIATQDGCWMGIGDVAGHGVRAGLVMLMTQSMVATLTRAFPKAPPSQLVVNLNSVLHDNLCRLNVDEHVTLSLLRWFEDGRLQWAGAHEDILVLRAEQPACERLPTPGTWLGPMHDISSVTRDSEVRLAPGDLVCLHTDGITEAGNDRGEPFGMDRLEAALCRWRAESAKRICERILEAAAQHAPIQDDDRTVVVVRMVA